MRVRQRGDGAKGTVASERVALRDLALGPGVFNLLAVGVLGQTVYLGRPPVALVELHRLDLGAVAGKGDGDALGADAVLVVGVVPDLPDGGLGILLFLALRVHERSLRRSTDCPRRILASNRKLRRRVDLFHGVVNVKRQANCGLNLTTLQLDIRFTICELHIAISTSNRECDSESVISRKVLDCLNRIAC